MAIHLTHLRFRNFFNFYLISGSIHYKQFSAKRNNQELRIILLPIAPEIILSIPCMNKFIDNRINIIDNVIPGYSNKAPESITTIIPIMIFAILAPLFWSCLAIPVATSPAPKMRTNNEVIQIRDANAAIGCAIVKKPPIIAIIPIMISIILVPFEVDLWKNPLVIEEIPTTNKDIPRNVMKNQEVAMGFARTYPDNAIAIPPVTN